jgi:hypothetical protein
LLLLDVWTSESKKLGKYASGIPRQHHFLTKLNSAMGTVSRLVAKIVHILLLVFINLLFLLGSAGLGGLISLGLTELSAHGLFLRLLSFLISSSIFLVLFSVLKWFGLLDTRGLMSALFYSGAIAQVVWHSSAELRRPWWITVSLAVVCIILGLVKSIGRPGNPYLEPGDHISFTFRLLHGDRSIAYLLAHREAARRISQFPGR